MDLSLRYFSVLATLMLMAACSLRVSAVQDWSIRLRDGTTPYGGRVEVWLAGEWGTITDSSWSIEEAHVVCRQLGFSTAQAATIGDQFPPAILSHIPNHIDGIHCAGEEASISECSYQQVNQSFSTSHTLDAGVLCAGEYSVRLSNDGGSNMGRLEVRHDNIWRPICFDSSWQMTEATVACRQLGYEQLTSYRGVSGQSAVTAVSATPLNCSGREFQIQSCPDFSLRQEACSSELVLECVGRPSTPNLPTVVSINCSAVAVHWSVPESRGSPITSYTIRHTPLVPLPTDLPPTESVVWTTVSSHDGNTLVIDRLRPFVDYEFQVSAVNGIGMSPFSDSGLLLPLTPELLAPDNLRIEERRAMSSTVSWTVPITCGLRNISYEVLYNIRGAQFSSFSFHDTILLSDTNTPHNHTMAYVLRSLLPFTDYSVKVRMVARVSIGNSPSSTSSGRQTVTVASHYSDPLDFQTDKHAPSGSPQAFTAFLTQLQSAAYFSWESVSPHLTNGLIIGYSLSCRCQKDGLWRWVRETVDNSTFSLELEGLVPATKYECTVSAQNEIGMGPESSSILFMTPADLNRRPSAPRNVAFAIVSPNTDRNSFFVQATWEMYKCRSNFSCIELLGYVISCREDSTQKDVLLTVWLSDIEDLESMDILLPVKPFTRYTCWVAAMNTYGVGQPGSRIAVRTPEIAPSLPPTQLFTTNIETTSVRVHWTYSETPKAGVLIGFSLDVYSQDVRYPERTGELLNHDLFLVNHDDEINFSYLVSYLNINVKHNILVSALTNAGKGPQGRVSVTTQRLIPQMVATNIQTEITSNVKPYPVNVRWSVQQSTNIQQPADYVGFTIDCFTNISGISKNLLSHIVFTDDDLLTEYSVRLLFPAQCDSQNSIYFCSISAFNENGVGMRSKPASFYLACGEAGNIFAGSFLMDPIASIAFLSIVILLVIVLLITLIMCCLCLARNRRYAKQERYTTVGGFDEGYISMAPSGSTTIAIKSRWSGNHSYTHTDPSSTEAARRLSVDQDGNPFNHYDEIPGDRLSKTENVYDEIPLRLTTPTSTRDPDSSIRSFPMTQRVTCPSIRSISSCHTDKSYDYDQSQVTTVTDISRANASDNTLQHKRSNSLSSENSLVKLKAEGKLQHMSTSQKRTSGYVEIVTAKDGKRHVKEDTTGEGRDKPKTPGHSELATPTAAASLSRNSSFHSYQNVTDVGQQAPDMSLNTERVSNGDARVRETVTESDFQLSTVSDSVA